MLIVDNAWQKLRVIMMRFTCIGTLQILGILVFTSANLCAKELSEELKFHQKTLTDAKIPLTAEGMLTFFRSRTPSKEDLATWKVRINELGARDYRIREKATVELIRAGWPVMAYLQQAAKSFDMEVARRAARCIEAIGQTPNEDLLVAAAAMTVELKPKGAVKVILNCLPGVTEKRARDALYDALRKVDLQDKVVSQSVIKAIKDENVILREAAVYVLAQAPAQQRKLAFELLNDAEISVRFTGAMELTLAQERNAIPHLINLLHEVDRARFYQIEDVLYHLAGEKTNITSPVSWGASTLQKYRKDWLTWWDKEGAKVDLARLHRRDILLGLHLIVELSGGPSGRGRVYECGRDGKPRWQITTASGPIDAQLLPNGNVLIAEHGGRCVTIRDKKGRELWKHMVNNSAVACKYLRNGNIFVAHYGGAMEITPANKVVYSVNGGGSIYHGTKLRNGHVLLSSGNNKIIEMDTKGTTIHTINVQGTGYWCSAEKLPNGRYLVTAGSGGKVVEVDKSGKIHWQWSAPNLGHATRLPNGNTLITQIAARKIYEVNRAGTTVWSMTTPGTPFHAYRR